MPTELKTSEEKSNDTTEDTEISIETADTATLVDSKLNSVQRFGWQLNCTSTPFNRKF